MHPDSNPRIVAERTLESARSFMHDFRHLASFRLVGDAAASAGSGSNGSSGGGGMSSGSMAAAALQGQGPALFGQNGAGMGAEQSVDMTSMDPDWVPGSKGGS